MSGPLLTGLLAKQIYQGFKGKLLSGLLWRYTPGAGVDPHGDPNPGTWAPLSLEGMIETYDSAYRARAGIPQDDVKILIFAQSLSTSPTKADVIFMRGQYWQSRQVETDPAIATWTLQAFGVTKPVGVP